MPNKINNNYKFEKKFKDKKKLLGWNWKIFVKTKQTTTNILNLVKF
jgi:hypothetical protein